MPIYAPNFKSVGVSLGLGRGHDAAAANAPPLEHESQTIPGAYRVDASVRTRPHQHSCTLAGPKRHARDLRARTLAATLRCHSCCPVVAMPSRVHVPFP